MHNRAVQSGRDSRKNRLGKADTSNSACTSLSGWQQTWLSSWHLINDSKPSGLSTCTPPIDHRHLGAPSTAPLLPTPKALWPPCVVTCQGTCWPLQWPPLQGLNPRKCHQAPALLLLHQRCCALDGDTYARYSVPHAGPMLSHNNMSRRIMPLINNTVCENVRKGRSQWQTLWPLAGRNTNGAWCSNEGMKRVVQ
jgi:hypothetical protein